MKALVPLLTLLAIFHHAHPLAGEEMFAEPEAPTASDALPTAEWIQVNAAALEGRMVEVGIERASPMEQERADEWRDFYCFTPAGSIHVLVPAELAPTFFERYGSRAPNGAPHKLAAFVQRANDGRAYLRVRAPTSQSRVWTSADARRVEADYVWANDTEVCIRRVSDGKTFTIAIRTLSSDDQAYIKMRRSGAR